MRRLTPLRLLGVGAFAAFTAACLVAALSVSASADGRSGLEVGTPAPLVGRNPALDAQPTATTTYEVSTTDQTVTGPPSSSTQTVTNPDGSTSTVVYLYTSTILEYVSTTAMVNGGAPAAAAAAPAVTTVTSPAATSSSAAASAATTGSGTSSTTARHTSTGARGGAATQTSASTSTGSTGTAGSGAATTPSSSSSSSSATSNASTANSSASAAAALSGVAGSTSSAGTAATPAAVATTTAGAATTATTVAATSSTTSAAAAPTAGAGAGTGLAGAGVVGAVIRAPRARSGRRTAATRRNAVAQRPAEATPAQPRYSYAPAWSRHSAAPSPLTNGLAAVGRAVGNPARLSLALGTGVVWTLFLVLATGLLEKTLKSLYEVWNAALAGGLSRIPARVQAGFAYLTSGGLLPLLAILAANITVLGFAEPGFGLNPGSLRLWLSMIGADVIGVVLPYVVTAAVARDRWHAPALTKAAPWGLLICLFGVGASRVLNFVPGLLTGSTVQLDTRRAAIPDRVRIQTLRLSLTIFLGIWFWLATAAVPDHGSWSVLLLRDTLAGGAVVALMSSLIELLPLTFLSGGLLFAHARRRWIAMMSVGTAAFVVAIAPQPRFVLRVHGPAMWWLTAGMVVLIIAAAVLTLHRSHTRRVSLVPA